MTSAYPTDVPYVRTFTRELAPAWLDHVALISGFASPERESGFAWCDLGCGHGLTAAIVAATHPQAVVHGVDAIPAHIESARVLTAHAAIPNIKFHAARFDEAAEFDIPAFDYIVSHGVYSWIGEAARDSWLRFVDRRLKPGGLLYLSYNAMPGRAADLPLQRLVHALGTVAQGDSQERVLAALRIVQSMMELKAPSLVASPMAALLKEPRDWMPPAYLAHEFMSEWQPFCVTEVRASLASIGLRPAGSATLLENYDSFVLGRAARQCLSAIENPDVRELARDFLIDQFFRRDVFVREGHEISEDERRSRLLDSTFYLARGASTVRYSVATPAGKLRFENATARHIVAALADGPRRLTALAEGSAAPRDLLANALALCAAGVLWPVEARRAPVDCLPVVRLNDVLSQSQGGTGGFRYTVLPFGTAVEASSQEPPG